MSIENRASGLNALSERGIAARLHPRTGDTDQDNNP